MIIETIYIGRNNSFSLQLIRGNEAINLASINTFTLYLNTGLVFDDPAMFISKPDGVVEIVIGTQLTEDDLGNTKAHLVTTDPINTAGVRWPTFILKVRE